MGSCSEGKVRSKPHISFSSYIDIMKRSVNGMRFQSVKLKVSVALYAPDNLRTRQPPNMTTRSRPPL
jgi:hypothetical protein